MEQIWVRVNHTGDSLFIYSVYMNTYIILVLLVTIEK
jgi:hypothetical protein